MSISFSSNNQYAQIAYFAVTYSKLLQKHYNYTLIEKVKRKILKAAKEKNIIFKELIKKKSIADFSTETMEARRQ